MNSGFIFSEARNEEDGAQTPYEKLFDIFQQLLLITSGDIGETLSWMNELDRRYQLTDNKYGMGDFIEELKEKGMIREEESGEMKPSAAMEIHLRQAALEEIFGKIKKSGPGEHKTGYTGKGEDLSPETRPYRFGDAGDQIEFAESMRQAQIRSGIDNTAFTEDDLIVREKEHASATATVLMIDISHSMILYGEDRITPAKKVAMALAELMKRKYPRDFLDIIVFGNEAWSIEIKDLPYLKVGPYHTNTVAGLELAMNLLRKRKTPNKQIFMITDGKPTCLKENGGYYRNSFGLDPKILNKTLNQAAALKRMKIPVTTFMIASDPYLKEFVREFTQINNGQAFYSDLNNLGHFVFESFSKNRKKHF
jgi:Ca-activated chloride channel homolog